MPQERIEGKKPGNEYESALLDKMEICQDLQGQSCSKQQTAPMMERWPTAVKQQS